MDQQAKILRRIRWILGAFVVALVLSGMTAVPVQWELRLLTAVLGMPEAAAPEAYTGLRHWLATVQLAVNDTYGRWPFLAYGNDWLAFAHVVIAVMFVGAIRDPVRNVWVITFGLIACVLVVPTAMVFGAIRGIPPAWRLIDCAFGAVGFVPLWIARRYTLRLAGSAGHSSNGGLSTT